LLGGKDWIKDQNIHHQLIPPNYVIHLGKVDFSQNNGAGQMLSYLILIIKITFSKINLER
jgi:hypothetical protein